MGCIKMYQNVILYTFSNETLPFFSKLGGAKTDLRPPPKTRFFNSIFYALWLSNPIKTRHFISTKSISALVHGLKPWIFCETLTVFKFLLKKCKTFETVIWVKGWRGRSLRMWRVIIIIIKCYCGWKLWIKLITPSN